MINRGAQPDLSSVDVDQLPPQLRQLIRLIGIADTWLLLRERGGTTLQVPVRAERSALIDIISANALALLCKEFGGTRLELPVCDSIMRQVRNQQILSDRAQGMSYPALATLYGLTRRQVINICGSGLEENPTLSLFGDHAA